MPTCQANLKQSLHLGLINFKIIQDYNFGTDLAGDISILSWRGFSSLNWLCLWLELSLPCKSLWFIPRNSFPQKDDLLKGAARPRVRLKLAVFKIWNIFTFIPFSPDNITINRSFENIFHHFPLHTLSFKIIVHKVWDRNLVCRVCIFRIGERWQWLALEIFEYSQYFVRYFKDAEKLDDK